MVASRPSSTARSATRVSSVKNSGVSSSPYSLASPSFAVRKSKRLFDPRGARKAFEEITCWLGNGEVRAKGRERKRKKKPEMS